jgi:hypothetical protein
MVINLSDYYAGGYLLIRAGKPDWEQLKTDLLPDKVISLSQCINQRLYIHWGWLPGDRAAAIRFGIPESEIEAFVQWTRTEMEREISFPSAFISTQTARHFAKRFLPDTTDLSLIGVGLPREIAEIPWRDAAEGDGKLYGVAKHIEKRLPLEHGGSALGFEVVSFDYGDFGHSWLCNYIHEDMAQLYGIRPNQYSLIDTEDDARKVYQWIDEDKMQGRRAEPEPYDYWLLVSYPLEA